MIPRIIHYVWVGPNKLPEAMQAYIAGWKVNHPDFELKLWTESNIDFSIPYLKIARDNEKWSNISNLIRLRALQEYGGIYLDTDVEVLKPFHPLLSHKCFLGFQEKNKQPDWVNVAVLGAEREHWFIAELAAILLRIFDGREEANLSAPRLSTLLLVRLGLKEYSDNGVKLGDISIFPTRYFYPFPWQGEFTEECVTPDTYAIHHWAKSW